MLTLHPLRQSVDTHGLQKLHFAAKHGIIPVTAVWCNTKHCYHSVHNVFFHCTCI